MMSSSGDKIDNKGKQRDYLFQTSKHAALYAAFRPRPPTALLQRISSHTPHHDVLLDVGCGTGQSTEPMASFFRKVVGLDVSSAQISQAEKNKVNASITNIEYRVGPAYPLPFEKNSFDVVTGSQCVHWFDLDQFYPEVHRVLGSGGILALYGYCVPIPKIGTDSVDRQVEELIMTFYRDKMGSYWELDRSLIDECYRTLPRPREGFTLVEHDEHLIEKKTTTLGTYISYLSSWSSYQKFLQVHPDQEDPLKRLHQDLARIYGFVEGDDSFDVETNFFLLVYRKK